MGWPFKEFAAVNSLDGRRVWGRIDTYTCMGEFLCSSPETITTLLISYTPIQNKKFRKMLIAFVITHVIKESAIISFHYGQKMTNSD